GTNSARSAAAAASARGLALWPAAEDGAGADGDAGRAEAPVPVFVTTAAVMVKGAQPAVMAAASRIRPKARFRAVGRRMGHAGSGSDGWLPRRAAGRVKGRG